MKRGFRPYLEQHGDLFYNNVQLDYLVSVNIHCPILCTKIKHEVIL